MGGFTYDTVEDAIANNQKFHSFTESSVLCREMRSAVDWTFELYELPLERDVIYVREAVGHNVATLYPLGAGGFEYVSTLSHRGDPCDGIANEGDTKFVYDRTPKEFLIVGTEDARDPPLPSGLRNYNADIGTVVRHEIAHACEMIETEGVSHERDAGHQEWLDRLNSI